MAAGDYAVFNLDGTGEVVLPIPQQATWEQPVIGETFTRKPLYDAYKLVGWSWTGPLTTTHYDAIMNKRDASSGLLRFRTKNNRGQMVECVGITDLFPAGTMKDGAWYGVAVQLWQVLEVP